MTRKKNSAPKKHSPKIVSASKPNSKLQQQTAQVPIVKSWRQYKFMLAIVIILLGGHYFFGHHSMTENEIKQKIMIVGKTYLNQKPTGKWWLEEVGAFSDVELSKKLTDRKSQILAMLKKYRNISPKTREVVDSFPDLRIGVIRDNGIAWTARSPRWGICFVSMNQEMKSGHSFEPPIWDANIGSCIVPGYEYNPVLFAGLLFHELGHGMIHSVHGISDNQDHVFEEVEMHELQLEVMNYITRGRLFEVANKILEKGPESFKEAVAYIEPEDFKVFDASLQNEVTLNDARLLALDYSLAVAFRFIDRMSVDKDKKLSLKAECYKWLVELAT